MTLIQGLPKREDREKLRKEIEDVLVDIRLPVLAWVSKYGLIAEARTQTEYKHLSGKTYQEPSKEEPKIADPTILKTTSKHEREIKRAK